MKIAIDGNEANTGQRVGIGEYAYQLITNLSKYQKKHTFTILLKDPPGSHLPLESNKWKYRLVGPPYLWSQIAFPYYLVTNRHYDVVFSPTHYGPRLSPIPSVISIMDLSYLYYPNLFKKSDLYKLTNWTAYSVRQAAYILTISEFSKNAIIKNYKVNHDKVVVTYPGYNRKVYNTNYKKDEVDTIKDKYGLGEYIIFVGTIQPRKNIIKLAGAYKLLLSKYPRLKLVIVGKKGWLFESIFEWLDPYIKERRILYLDYLKDKEIALLYQNALVFVLPSLYEGFGLTVVEAMACGCPVAVSNVTSLPEIAGGQALLFDPNSQADIAEKIASLLTLKTSEKNKVIKKGILQAQKYSWDECGQKTIEVIERIRDKK